MYTKLFIFYFYFVSVNTVSLHTDIAAELQHIKLFFGPHRIPGVLFSVLQTFQLELRQVR